MLRSPSPAPDSTRARASGVCRSWFAASLAAAAERPRPFPHRLLADALPPKVIAGLVGLDIAAPALDGESGAREAHNDSRSYLDPDRIAGCAVCAAVADAFQAPATVALVEATFDVELTGCFLRMEYAQDTEGFWLTPHTDLGVKRFTLLCYLGPEGRPELGTDLYDDRRRWVTRGGFAPGQALAFIPGDRSWHGFEPRPIGCVRRSLIVNYVTADWRAREQLAFPQTPVRGRAPTDASA